jgi:Tol biopolymer transport system component
LIDVATGEETLLASITEDAWPTAWTRDGRALLYETERLGKVDLWLVRVSDGKPQGEPIMVRAGFTGESQGITNDGTLYYGTWSGGSRVGPFGESHIYTAALDLKAGSVVATPLTVEKSSSQEDYSSPTWSPAGDMLAYKAVGQSKDFEIRIVSFDGVATRNLKPPLRTLNGIQWSPDGKSFVGTVLDQVTKHSGIYRIDAHTGALSTIIEPRPNVSGSRSLALNGPLTARECFTQRAAIPSCFAICNRVRNQKS